MNTNRTHDHATLDEALGCAVCQAIARARLTAASRKKRAKRPRKAKNEDI